MSSETPHTTAADALDLERLRGQVRQKYQEVAGDPSAGFHFFTGRRAAATVGYPTEIVDDLPDDAVAAFAGVANPFHWGMPAPGETVVDVGSGGGLDGFIAARSVGPGGRVVGIDMTPTMLERATTAASSLGLDNIEFRHGYAEDLPVPDGWADVVISNGVLNLVPDKLAAYREIFRVLKPGGRIQIADITVDKPVPEGAKRDIDLWTG